MIRTLRTLFEGEGRESGVSPSRGGVCYKSCDAFVQPAFFLAKNRARNAGGQRHRVQKLVYFRNSFSSILSIRISDRSAQFLVNCLGKIVMAANNSGFYSTFLRVSEERRERERRERHTARINRRASEEDSSGKFMQHLRLVY